MASSSCATARCSRWTRPASLSKPTRSDDGFGKRSWQPALCGFRGYPDRAGRERCRVDLTRILGDRPMSTHTMPSADIVFDTLFAYQRSAALGSAIDLDVFTAIDGGARTGREIADRCGAPERAIRILCDYLS